jgi:predicted CxxxxCH...CXXCH cytochrome family protein
MRATARPPLGIAALMLLGASCSMARTAPQEGPVYDEDVAPLLARRCLSCHGPSAPAAGWTPASYLQTIACVAPEGAPATLPGDASAPILRALGTPPHEALLTADERSTLQRWINSGAPAFRGTVHAAGFIDPRSEGFHGAALRAKRWAPMLDANDPDACGRCHDGAPARPKEVTFAAPGATACTTCHSEAGGVLACSTCHSQGKESVPPRDPCFFPTDRAGAHTAHIAPTPSHASGFACSTCHPMPGANVIGGAHGNGSVEIEFDRTIVTTEASYAKSDGTCSVACHDRGGARAKPGWNDATPMGCADCHQSQKKGHFPGPCTNCHRDVDATGTALTGGPMHMNGHVDLGDGSGQCGACHGQGQSAWPATAAHPAHEQTSITAPIECSSCHTVPSTLLATGHLDGIVEVALSGRAKDRGAEPAWSGSSCDGVACHGAGLVDSPQIPTWKAPATSPVACGPSCHGVPPSQHTASTSCDRATCHGNEIARSAQGAVSITTGGRALHINGTIDYAH